jgi:hypothetical protein
MLKHNNSDNKVLSDTLQIPCNFYQTWATKNISEELKQIINTWKINNPEYNYYLYDNDDCEEFIKKNFDERIYNAYCKIIPGAYKADFWRYCILYIHGGVYVDIDTLCLGKINTFLNKDIDFMVPIDLNINNFEGKHNLFNSFIASIAQHEILKNCIDYIVNLIENNIIPQSKLDFSGPGCLGRSTNKYLNLDETSAFPGKEGIHKNIHFLKFEPGSEYVKDIHNNILFQNKNGNPNIINIYNNEISKINHISWLITKPFINNGIFVGSSNTNTKVIQLKEKTLIGHNLLNYQCPAWGDTFDIKINNKELIIKRIDLDCGWGQQIELPIKYNKIIIYNGFSFHYEMMGFILEFCQKYNIEAIVVLKYIDQSWIDLYKTKYNFVVLEDLPDDLDYYLFVLLLTDDDFAFPEHLINENTVCIDHYYKNRRPKVKYHIQIEPFNEDIKLYALPIFKYMNYEDKVNILNKQSRPIITFLGRCCLPDNINTFSLIDNIDDFDIYIINRKIPKDYINLPNIYLYENITAEDMFDLLGKTTYMCYIPNEYILTLFKACNGILTSSTHMSFTTGCKLILPKFMNEQLKLQSIIEYSNGDKLLLDKNPSLIDTFDERERLLTIRDETILNIKHMKLFLEYKKID